MQSFASLRNLPRVLVAAAFLAIAACGGSKPASSSSAPAAASATDDPSCPVTVPGTSVSVEDTATGAALVFVTTGDVAAVRQRVAALAGMHNDHHGKMGPLPDGSGGGAHAGHGGMDHGSHAAHGGGGHGGHGSAGDGEHAGHAGGMIGVHSKAEVAEIDGGARVVLVAGPDDVAKLQSELRMHAEHLSSGTCKMGGQ